MEEKILWFLGFVKLNKIQLCEIEFFERFFLSMFSFVFILIMANQCDYDIIVE